MAPNASSFGSNINLGQMLSGIFGNAAAINASKTGTVTPIDPNTMQPAAAAHPILSAIDAVRPAIDFLGGAYTAHAANPAGKGVALAGLTSMVDQAAQRNYMNQLNQQYQNEQKLKLMGMQQMGGYLGVDPNGPYKGYFFGDNDAYKSANDSMGRAGYAQGVNTALQGQNIPQFTGHEDPAQLAQFYKDWSEASQGAAGFQGMAGMANAASNGQGVSQATTPPTGNSLGQPGAVMGPKANLSGLLGQLAGSQFNYQPSGLDLPGQPIQGNVSAQAPAPGEAPPPAQVQPQAFNPTYMPKDFPSNASGLFTAGMTDAQRYATQAEENRKNRADEAQKQQIINATKANQGGYGRNPSYPPQPTDASLAAGIFANDPTGMKAFLMNHGGAVNPYTVPNSALEGVKKNLDINTQQLKDIGAVDSSGKLIEPNTSWWSGGNASPQQVQQYQQLLQQRQALTQQANQLQQGMKTAGQTAVGNMQIQSPAQWAASRGK